MNDAMKKSMNKSRKKWNVSLAIGTVLILAVVIVCIVSFIYMPHDPIEMNTTLNFLRPGANESYIFVGVVSTAFGAVIGIILGGFAAMSKNIVSSIIMRFVDGMMAFPGILLAMMLVLVVGRGEKGSIVAIAMFIVPTFARLVYSMVLDTESMLFVKAAKSYGITKRRLFFLRNNIRQRRCLR